MLLPAPWGTADRTGRGCSTAEPSDDSTVRGKGMQRCPRTTAYLAVLHGRRRLAQATRRDRRSRKERLSWPLSPAWPDGIQCRLQWRPPPPAESCLTSSPTTALASPNSIQVL